jgi:hypothetical protein
MGYLFQPSSPIADSNSYSASFWSRIGSANLPPGGAQVALFQHGPHKSDLPWAASANDYLGVLFSGLYVDTSAAGPGQLVLSGSSRGNAVSVVNDHDGNRAPGTAYFCANIGSSAFFGDTQVTYPLNQWVHCAYSVEIRETLATFVDYHGPFSTARYDPTSYSLCNFFVNAANASPRLGDDRIGGGMLPGDYIGFPSTNPTPSGMPRGFRSGSTWWASDSDYWPTDEEADIRSDNFPTAYPVPTYNLAFNNLRFGLPSHYGFQGSDAFKGESSDANPKIEYADFQLWVGQYVDWAQPSNFSNVVTIKSGKGYPASTDAAAAAFGRQTVLFKGKASDGSFFFNRGTSGAFSKIGTATDFTPTPSY